jgi:hypothetical protein
LGVEWYRSSGEDPVFVIHGVGIMTGKQTTRVLYLTNYKEEN